MTAFAPEDWQMIENSVLELFGEVTAQGSNYQVIGPRLAELGWSEIEAEYPIEATELLFRTQGRGLAQTDCLQRVLVAELAPVLEEPVDAVVLPMSGRTAAGDADDAFEGCVIGPLDGPHGRLAVAVGNTRGGVSVHLIDASSVTAHRMNTFDPTVYWTAVSGPLLDAGVNASSEWSRALGAAQRALATELVALADQTLSTAIEHVSSRVQFGTPIGAMQSPRHALAEASARVDGARALLAISWQYGGKLGARVAKAAAGRAHRAASDAALQVCGAIGLTSEHRLHRYVARGFQIDALCGSYEELESLLAEQLFDEIADEPLPSVIAWP